MIEFYGEWDEMSKNFLKHVCMKGVRQAASVCMVILGIMFGILCFADGGTGFFCRAVIVSCVIIYIIVMIFPKLALPNKILFGGCPYTISIEGEKIICDGSADAEYYSKEFLDVKSVLDYGSFYYIKFYFRQVAPCICQKDLIVKGTIEEFEELFEGKIVRKIKKTK